MIQCEYEIWKSVVGFEGFYEVSNFGRVKSLDRVDKRGRFQKGKIKTQINNGSGYMVVSLKKDGKQKMRSVHRLVADSFIPNPLHKPCVNHLDGDKSNNKVVNLVWCTYVENMKHAVETGLYKNVHGRKVLCVELNKTFNSLREAERFVGVRGSRLSNVCKLKRGSKTCGGFHWRYL